VNAVFSFTTDMTYHRIFYDLIKDDHRNISTTGQHAGSPS